MKNTNLFITLVIVIAILFGWIMFSESENLDVAENMSGDQQLEDETQILLYFLEKDGVRLVEEYRYVSVKSIKDDMIKTLIDELIKGPNSNDLNATLPKETKINSIIQENNKVVVDFSKEFNNDSGDADTKLQRIYSVVNTLTEIKEIDEVEIKVEGESIATEKRI